MTFHTLTSPEFRFQNLPSGNLITGSSYTASVYYHSLEFEPLNKYRFYLYDSAGMLRSESPDLYDADDISYTFRGLDSSTLYQIRCIGTTLHGMPLDTGPAEIFSDYEEPNSYARIYTENVPEQGSVHVSTNLIIIQYNGSEIFEYENGMINLIDKTLYYNEGFLLKDDFTLIIRGVNLWQNTDIFMARNAACGLTLSSRIYSDGTLRFRLRAPNGPAAYIRYSESLTFTNSDMITISLRRQNNLYDLEAAVTPAAAS